MHSAGAICSSRADEQVLFSRGRKRARGRLEPRVVPRQLALRERLAQTPKRLRGVAITRNALRMFSSGRCGRRPHYVTELRVESLTSACDACLGRAACASPVFPAVKLDAWDRRSKSHRLLIASVITRAYVCSPPLTENDNEC